jgi:soluble lytic murein transglycosylase-like protein
MRNPAIKKILCLTFYSLPVVAFAANFTEPRTHVVSPQRMETHSPPVQVIINKSHRAQIENPTRIPAIPSNLQSGKPSAGQVKAYVQTQAMQHGVDPKLALWIVRHESSFDPRAQGDGEASRGLWQISKIYHPEVSDATAFDVASSTAWSLERIRSGKVKEWSTYRFCRTLYGDCPF